MIRNLSPLRTGALALMAALTLAAPAAASAPATTAPLPAATTFAMTPVGSDGAMLLHGIPGQVLRGAIRVRNLTRHPITIILQAADIDSAANGNADYQTTKPSQTGRWLALSTGSLQLAPSATQTAAFTVTIPAGTTGASHYAGIVALDAAEVATAAARTGAKRKTFTFYRVNRQALPITIRLPGPLTRSLTLQFAKLIVEPVGASIELGLLPGGTQLIQSA